MPTAIAARVGMVECPCCISNSVFTVRWILHAFWVVLIYDVLEDRQIVDVTTDNGLLFCNKKQIDVALPCVCLVIDRRWRQSVLGTKKWHTGHSRVCHSIPNSVEIGCKKLKLNWLTGKLPTKWRKSKEKVTTF